MSLLRPENVCPATTTAKQPLNVHLYLTPNCNLSCRHCYYRAWPANRRAKRLLTPREIGSVITEISDCWDADFHVEGGEIFLRQDLPEIIESISGHYWGAVTLTTNATVPITLSPAQLRLFGNLRISAESHRDSLHRDIRGVSLRPILRTCEELAAHGTPYEVRMTVVRENVDELPEMVRFFAELGAARLSLYEFQALGRGTTEAARYSLDEADVVRLLHVLTAIDPLNLERLTLSLPPRRSATVNGYGSALASSYEIVQLWPTPSLTINPDGAIGVSPWRATADGLGDRFAHIDETDLAVAIAARLSDGTLYQLCSNCTAVQLRARLRTKKEEGLRK